MWNLDQSAPGERSPGNRRAEGTLLLGSPWLDTGAVDARCFKDTCVHATADAETETSSRQASPHVTVPAAQTQRAKVPTT